LGKLLTFLTLSVFISPLQEHLLSISDDQLFARFLEYKTTAKLRSGSYPKDFLAWLENQEGWPQVKIPRVKNCVGWGDVQTRKN
jgi:hypothetical protein